MSEEPYTDGKTIKIHVVDNDQRTQSNPDTTDTQANGTPQAEAPASEHDAATTGAGAASHEVVEGEIVEEAPVTAETVEIPPPDSGDLQQRLAQAEAQALEWKNQWLRSVADFKNYKRRTETERDDLKRNANAGLLLKILPILDDFERAVDNVPADIAGTPWWEGTKMIAQKMRTLLESEGVTTIEAVGQPFDPNLHHAVAFDESHGQSDMVTEELQKGYKIHDRVLRPAMVRVAK